MASTIALRPAQHLRPGLVALPHRRLIKIDICGGNRVFNKGMMRGLLTYWVEA